MAVFFVLLTCFAFVLPASRGTNKTKTKNRNGAGVGDELRRQGRPHSMGRAEGQALGRVLQEVPRGESKGMRP